VAEKDVVFEEKLPWRFTREQTAVQSVTIVVLDYLQYLQYL